MSRVNRALVTVAFVVAGALLGATAGLATAVVHRQTLRVSSVTVPWGLLLGLATSYTLIRALSLTGASVRGAAGCAVGWVVMVLVLHDSRPEGDFLVASDSLGYGFVLGGVVVVAFAVARSQATPRSGTASSEAEQ